MTNYERIKGMSIEEMTEFILSGANCASCVYKNQPCRMAYCHEGVERYLESEVEE